MLVTIVLMTQDPYFTILILKTICHKVIKIAHVGFIEIHCTAGKALLMYTLVYKQNDF